MRQRFAKLTAWLRQRTLDGRIENLRKLQRQKELRERREGRRVDEVKRKTLKGMGVDPAAARRAANRNEAPTSALMSRSEL